MREGLIKPALEKKRNRFTGIHKKSLKKINPLVVSLGGKMEDSMSTNSYADDVLKHLKENGSISSMEAISNYGCTRLSAVIYCLRQEGYKIVSERIKFKNRHGHTSNYVEYKLVGE